ncbi:hypothetical protein KXV85_002434, partial [Aspergillus fumigatus]
SDGLEDEDQSAEWQRHQTLPAGKQLLAPSRASPDVYVLCLGWGFRFIQLPDGRRQILNFLLPGDLISASSIFEERFHFSVKALTSVQVSGMRRTRVQTRLAANPMAMSVLAKSYATEAEAMDKMLIALGQCSAEERIAHLFLHLMRRIETRTIVHEQRYPFPLRQQHVADAVGLTPVHVSRVVSAFRDRGIADMSNGLLEVVDRHELERLSPLN